MNGGHGASGAIRMSASITRMSFARRPASIAAASFCQDCLVYLQAKPLCGQCKNQRLRALHRELPTSQLALLSLLLALFTGPLAFILYAMGVMGRGDTTKFPLLGLVPQLIALALGVWALQRIEKNRALGGQARRPVRHFHRGPGHVLVGVCDVLWAAPVGIGKNVPLTLRVRFLHLAERDEYAR